MHSVLLQEHLMIFTKDTVGETDQQHVSSGWVTFLFDMEEEKKCKSVSMSSRPSGAYLHWAGFTRPGEIQPGGDQ